MLLRKPGSIFWFRLAQFWGTYQGFRHSGPLTAQLRQTFYYPRSLSSETSAERALSRRSITTSLSTDPLAQSISNPLETLMTKLVALVPMRHHSQRVPGKNYRPLAGKPLYQHIIETLLACPEIDQVVVDTDSPPVMDGLRPGFSAGAGHRAPRTPARRRTSR